MKELIVFAVPPKNIREKIISMHTDIDDVYWSTTDDHHITLTYIGCVEDNIAEEIIEKLSEIDMNSFNTALENMGTFSNDNKGITFLWTGVSEVELMRELRRKINAILEENNFPHSTKEVYNPHMTIAILRSLNKGVFSNFIEENKNKEKLEFLMDRFVVYDSKSGDDFNRIYETCGIIKLK